MEINLENLAVSCMIPSPQQSPQRELFKIPLDERLIDMSHELVRLGEQIEWKKFEEQFGVHFCETQGRPGIPIRLLVGVHYLKHLHNLSDEQVVRRWRENPYWQHFCGCEYFEKRFPFDRSSMSRWRKKVGKEGVEALLQETLSVAYRKNILKVTELQELLADTTVQEKNITFPTDVKLYHRARAVLVKHVHAAGISLRQSYTRLSKRALLKANRYSAAKQLKRARREERKVRNYLGRVVREVQRATKRTPHLEEYFREVLLVSERVYLMKERGEKIYSLHEPHVECITKGKAHKRYEFGVKASVVTTAKSGFIVACDTYHNRPYDGHTLSSALNQLQQLTGRILSKEVTVSVDRGYRGHGEKRVRVLHPGLRRSTPKQKRLIRRRASVEATISCLKRCHRLGRNFLKGILGDHINALLAAAAYNLGKILRASATKYYAA